MTTKERGVDTFTPSRLVLARERHAITQRALSAATGLSVRTIKGYESGDNLPSVDALNAIANAIGYPVEFFEEPEIDPLKLEAASFRALSKASAKMLNRAVASGTYAVGLLHPYLQQHFHLPKVDVPDLREETPMAAAELLRHHWGRGQQPIQHIVKLMEAHGVRVFSLSEDCDAIDAFSLWRDGVPFVFLNTRKTPERGIFDAAHELGHLVLHRHGVPQGHDAESEADKFASCFLMPEAAIRADAPLVTTVMHVAAMKRKWRASTAALGRRLRDLGLMTDYVYTRFNKELAYRGKHNEPMPLQRQTSVILQKTLTALAEEGLDLKTIAHHLCLPIAELRALTFGFQSIAGAGSARSAPAGNLRLVQ
jgi:Zn-dependent peptidase ImmA (M78 family)/transcriptional regulator with XRE-family HTH domain